MKTATVRLVRHDFGTVLNWVEQGEEVEIRKRGKVVARLTPPPAKKAARRAKRPDFAARLHGIFGNQRLKGDVIVEERDSRDY